MSQTDDAFGRNYFVARQKFRDAADDRGWHRDQYSIDVDTEALRDDRPPQPLTIDVARSSSAGQSPVLLVTSGLHGVEGYFGSAVQTAVMQRMPILRRCRLVLVHCLNPYGMWRGRRVDDANVDLNRNFLPSRPDASPGFESHRPDRSDDQRSRTYRRIDPWLNPTAPPRSVDGFYPRVLWEALRHSPASLQRAIATGQRSFPGGLFYAGNEPRPTIRWIRSNWSDWIGDASEVLHLDLHTGLGRYGQGQLIAESEAALNHATGRFGNDDERVGGVNYRAAGSFGSECERRFSDGSIRYHYYCGEFGTRHPLRVLSALRWENNAFAFRESMPQTYARAARHLRWAFCPDDMKWRDRVVTTSLRWIREMVAALGEEN